MSLGTTGGDQPGSKEYGWKNKWRGLVVPQIRSKEDGWLDDSGTPTICDSLTFDIAVVAWYHLGSWAAGSFSFCQPRPLDAVAFGGSLCTGFSLCWHRDWNGGVDRLMGNRISGCTELLAGDLAWSWGVIICALYGIRLYIMGLDVCSEGFHGAGEFTDQPDRCLQTSTKAAWASA